MHDKNIRINLKYTNLNKMSNVSRNKLLPKNPPPQNPVHKIRTNDQIQFSKADQNQHYIDIK